MRSMKKMGSVVGLMVAVMALTGAASATASPLITPAGTAFTATSTTGTEHVFSISSNIKVRCNHARFTGTTANPASANVTFTATYGAAATAGAWCRLYVGGVFSAATVAPSSTWGLATSTFNAGTGASTGSVTTSGATTITVGTCVITVPTATTVGITGQNDNPTPGVELTASGSGLSYTSSGCGAFGVPASGNTATYTGVVYIPNLYVS